MFKTDLKVEFKAMLKGLKNGRRHTWRMTKTAQNIQNIICGNYIRIGQWIGCTAAWQIYFIGCLFESDKIY